MLMPKFIGTTIFLLLSFFIATAHAKCIYPIPDGGGATPTAPNTEGRIVKVTNLNVVIKSTTTHELVKIKLGKGQSIFSAFGGDDSIAALKAGQYAWVWYANCKPIQNGSVAQSAYFQIYSADPKDQPTKYNRARSKKSKVKTYQCGGCAA